MKLPVKMRKAYEIEKLMRKIRKLKAKEDKLEKEKIKAHFQKQNLKFQIVAIDPNISFTCLNTL